MRSVAVKENGISIVAAVVVVVILREKCTELSVLQDTIRTICGKHIRSLEEYLCTSLTAYK